MLKSFLREKKDLLFCIVITMVTDSPATEGARASAANTIDLVLPEYYVFNTIKG